MPDAFTPNRNIIQPQVGGDSGTWGGLLNNGVAAQLDTILGATQGVSITVADVTLSTAQWNNAAVKLTGALTGNRNLILPYQVGSITVAVGGLFVVDNETTGNFTVTVKTVAAGSVGVIVPQGVRTYLYSDTTNVYYADDSAAHFLTYAGSPNGNVAGVAGTLTTPPSLCWDYTNNVIYVCVTTGNAATAVWINSAATSATLSPPGGYITPVSGTPIIQSDSIAATTVYYTPDTSAFTPIHNGSGVVPYTFSELTLKLSASQAANNIYDVFLAYNGGTPVIGTGPSWAAGTGGSITAGSCARGTGVGSTAINRNTQGFWVNSQSIALIYNTGAGNVTITVPAGQGIFLGSLWIDSIGGQVTCHRSWGQNRKWGISNAYNVATTVLKAGDPTAFWGTATGTWGPSNTSTANSASTFQCLPQETVCAQFQQVATQVTNGGNFFIGIGLNASTGTPTGPAGAGFNAIGGTLGDFWLLNCTYRVPPSPTTLGINIFYAMQKDAGLNQTNYYGGSEANMTLSAQWRA